MRCNLCKKHICYSCCSELHTLLTQFDKKHNTLQEDKDAIVTNPWFIHAEKLLLDPTSFNNSTICVGHCCSFTSTIGKSPHPDVNIITPKTTSHHIPKEIVPQGSSSDSDAEYLPDKVLQKRTTSSLKRKKPSHSPDTAVVEEAMLGLVTFVSLSAFCFVFIGVGNLDRGLRKSLP